MGSSSSRKCPKRWTKQEDSILHEQVVKRYGTGEVKDWSRIANQLPGRTNKDCRKRWINQVCGGLRKGAWTADEDARLRDAMLTHGQKWTLIASEVGSRSADRNVPRPRGVDFESLRIIECAKRWQHNLDPELERGNWTSEEDEKLLVYVNEYGREWKRIQAAHFAKRSRNDLKNRYTILMRRVENPIVPSSHSHSGAAISPNSQASSSAMTSNNTDDEDSEASDIDMEDMEDIFDAEAALEAPRSMQQQWSKQLSDQPIDPALDQVSTNFYLDDSFLTDILATSGPNDPFQGPNMAYEGQPTIYSSASGPDEQEWMKLMGESRSPELINRDASASLPSRLPSLEEIDALSEPSIDLFAGSNITQGGGSGEFGLRTSSSTSVAEPSSSPVASVVIRADRCDWNTLKYLMVVTKPLKDQVQIEIQHRE
ncbi:hypothetical protein F5B22DRAFT_661967 [Xylaria bambusicola]|uniref:uncharacterized protein n=1 Tax=Xylaria bambusicola TaxID=326684 RepID=UPI00200817FF|nr:uncharacterized protein F5B22DRAFT_661967 [Xylaria bambusicola]KAI0521628.1 hypothetical protein F5B22DRAFT_661967 [Xylaria bambusicola]